MFILTLSIILAVLLDKLVGEAERFHPLVGFGNAVKRIERFLNKGDKLKFKGLVALIMCVIPPSVLGYLASIYLHDDVLAEVIFSAYVLYVAIGWRSFTEHAQAIFVALDKQDINSARDAVSRIVSRDCDQLNETEISVAATESVLENGADAIFAAIFWFLIAGVPGVICYRLVNTLDAMWGYKNDRFLNFGWAAARFDDALNYLPARLTALSYALVGHTRYAIRCWFTQAKIWKSPNAGSVMASGAGAIQVSLGGKAVYHGATHLRPLLGLRLSNITRANSSSIKAACKLVNKALYLWLFVLVSTAILSDIPATLMLTESLMVFVNTWLN